MIITRAPFRISFTGSHLARKLLREGHRVVCVDNFSHRKTARNSHESVRETLKKLEL